MPKIRSPWDLLKTLATIFLAFLAVNGIVAMSGKRGVVEMIAPTLADTFYKIFGDTILVIAYIFLFALIIMAVIAVVVFFKNRGKSKRVTITLDEDSINHYAKQLNDLRLVKAWLDKLFSELDKGE